MCCCFSLWLVWLFCVVQNIYYHVTHFLDSMDPVSSSGMWYIAMRTWHQLFMEYAFNENYKSWLLQGSRSYDPAWLVRAFLFLVQMVYSVQRPTLGAYVSWLNELINTTGEIYVRRHIPISWSSLNQVITGSDPSEVITVHEITGNSFVRICACSEFCKVNCIAGKPPL